MTENEIWDAKWLAFKLVVTNRQWETTPNSIGLNTSFTGQSIVDSVTRPEDKGAKEVPGHTYVNGVGTHSAVAKAFAATGIPLKDYPKLQAAARRALKRRAK